MSSLISDLPAWVLAAPKAKRNFRRAVHILLHAVATTPVLSRKLHMKGGILMALRYQSERFTKDVDFSTPEPYTRSAEDEFRRALEHALVAAPETLGYDLVCRIQKFDPQPGRDKTYVTLQLTIGYAQVGTPSYKRLLAGECTDIVGLDYSYSESIPEIETIQIDEEGMLCVYGLSTLVGEKLRALLQQPIRRRTRRQDVYDLKLLLDTQPQLQDQMTKARVLATLVAKCEEREFHATATSFDNPEVRRLALLEYATLATELPEGNLPPFDASFTVVSEYYRNLPW